METIEISKYALCSRMMVAGILHFVMPKFYLKIMPKYLPKPYELVILSGIAEMICGLLLLFPVTQSFAAYATIALLIAVFPANIEMAKIYYLKKRDGFWLTILRLPLQLLLIWWAFQFIK